MSAALFAFFIRMKELQTHSRMLGSNVVTGGGIPVIIINSSIISMWIVLLFFILFCQNKSFRSDYSQVGQALSQGPNWKFESTPTWADEFEYTGKPDASKWGYDIGGGGWGNNELQYYTDNIKNAAVAKGLLMITAIREPAGGREYSSARLVSKNKGDFLYGRIEVKAKLPTGKGTWPAIWMLPTDWEYGGWPSSGEIDIMEHVGFDQDRVHITVHTEAYNHSIGTIGQKCQFRISPLPNRMDSIRNSRLHRQSVAIRI